MPRQSDTPAAIRLDVVDLESPLPQFQPDGRHERTWVVGRRAGIPQGIVEVDLTGDAALVDRQRQALAELPEPVQVPGSAEVSDAQLPSITVVVPSIVARAEELEACLAGFDNLDYPDYEIIIVDNRRSAPEGDVLPDLLRGREKIRSVHQPLAGISAARNAGLAAATGEIVVFTDDDVQVDPRWLRGIGQRFVASPDLEAVTGLILPAELESPAQIWFERYYGGFSGERTFRPLTLIGGHGILNRSRVSVLDVAGQQVRSFAVYGAGAFGAGANMAFRRSTLQARGGFDLALGTGTPARGGEDLAALINILWAGGRIGFEPSAVVFHTHRRDYPALLHQLLGNGVGFTAMLTSLVSHDAGHILGIASQLPRAARAMFWQSVERVSGRKAGERPVDDTETSSERAYPRRLVVQELRGMLKGPSAYARSRRKLARTAVAILGTTTVRG